MQKFMRSMCYVVPNGVESELNLLKRWRARYSSTASTLSVSGWLKITDTRTAFTNALAAFRQRKKSIIGMISILSKLPMLGRGSTVSIYLMHSRGRPGTLGPKQCASVACGCRYNENVCTRHVAQLRRQHLN